MQRFFSSLVEMDQFTHSLDNLTSDNQCKHCSRNDQWVSHGYVRKKSGEKAGKRILCGKRYGKLGCGRTRQLFLQHIIPQRRYTLPKLLTFVLALIRGATVEQAYNYTVGHDHFEHRQAWCWLQALWMQMSRFRPALAITPDPGSSSIRYRSRRLSILLTTLKDWLRHYPDQPSIQVALQDRLC